jgi:hypothetical protein
VCVSSLCVCCLFICLLLLFAFVCNVRLLVFIQVCMCGFFQCFCIAVPTNYGYLPDASVLRAIVDLLLEAGKQGTFVCVGDGDGVGEEHVCMCV